MKVAVLACILCGLGASASAEQPAIPRSTPEIHMRMDESGRLDATVSGVPMPAPDQLSLYSSGEPSQSIRPTRITTYTEGNEPLAIAIMYPANSSWLGTTGANAMHSGLTQVASIFDQVSFAAKVPPGSRFALISYADHATTRVPWSPIANLRSAAFGSHASYPRQDQADYSAGLVAALDELERSGAPRQILISFDGDDFLEPTAAASAAVEKARRRSVVAYSLTTRPDSEKAGAPGHRSTLDRGIFELTGLHRAWTVNSSAGILQVVEQNILGEIADRWYATFDVRPLHLHGAHSLVLSLAGEGIDAVDVKFPPAPPPAWWDSRLRQLGLGAMLVGLLALALRWRFTARRR